MKYSKPIEWRVMDKLTPVEAIQLAIEEARKGLGYVSPNPPVGCVILDKDSKLLATGYHKKFGAEHAEIDALNNISNPKKLKGAQVYVTLEPCSHEGKTPSCAKRLSELPIAKVIYGLTDPNPLVSGQGDKILRNAGIEVEKLNKNIFPEEILEDLFELVEVFVHNQVFSKPFLNLKLASSLDGQIGLKNGESKWITCEQAREHVHYLRAIYDAVLVGNQTVLRDDPSLDIRHLDFPNKSNKVVVLDPDGKLNEFKNLKIFETHEPKDIYFINKYGIEPSDKAEQVICEYKENGFEMKMLLNQLFELKIFSILVEGGAKTASNLLKNKDFQRLSLFIAPKVLGSMSGQSWTQDFGVDKIRNAYRLRSQNVTLFDSDILVSGRID